MRDFAIRGASLVLLVVVGTLFSSSAFAQSSTPAGRFVTGPLTWTPAFQIREAGVDSNVFNTPLNPKQDVSGGALSQVNSILTLGLLQASTQGSVEYTYFERYTQERGFNRRVATHIEFPVSRFSPDINVAWDRVKERSGNEIDTRAPRSDFAYSGGIQTRLTSRIAVTASVGKQKASYESGFTFRDVNIANQLNRETTVASLTGHMTLTPFTVFALDASVGRDQFSFRPEATTDNIRANASLEFAPDAVIRGRASVGYHAMQPHRQVPGVAALNFSGISSTVDLGYTLFGVARFAGRFFRDSSYSIDTNQPVYVSISGSLEVLQRLFGPVDLDVRGTREKLDYPQTVLEAAHVDFADVLAGGLSIRAAPQTVVALLYDNSERRSTRGREFGYQRRRIYTTVTYGF